jgi:RNA-directed DNA polymerase
LLANVALHGLETAVRAAFPRSRRIDGKQLTWQPTVIRYADDVRHVTEC